MDVVFVTNLALEAIIGIHPEERTTAQPVAISFALQTDTRNAARSDDIVDAVDYEGACMRIAQLVSASHFQLIETMADQIAGLLLAEYPVSHVSVEVCKPDALDNAQTVGVRIERSKLA